MMQEQRQPTREQRTQEAFFRGATLALDNPRYRDTVSSLAELLLREDLGSADLTTKALATRERHVSAKVIAQEGGVAAGVAELAYLLAEHEIETVSEKNDGDAIRPGETLLRAEGPETKLLGLERVGLNLIQRMSGIATTARCLQERVQRTGSRARIVGTRKTPWGLLDKRALHLGGVGTHRLGLGDAILVKNNHLALLAGSEEEAAPIAIERAWRLRDEASFIEVEVRSETGARNAALAFRKFQEASGSHPCLLLLDNMSPERIADIIEMLRREDLWDCVLIEASGGINEASLDGYAKSGADALSMGALTHSARALDICLRIS